MIVACHSVPTSCDVRPANAHARAKNIPPEREPAAGRAAARL
jgi:hypothetical protein